MTMQPDWVPSGIDTGKAKAAPGATAKVAAAAEPTASDTLDRAKILFQASNPEYQKYAGASRPVPSYWCGRH